MTAKKLPPPWFVSPESLEAWARSAKAGEVTRYASAAFLPKGSRTGAVARALYEAGLVSLRRDREGEDRTSYFAKRTEKAWPAPGWSTLPSLVTA